MCVCFNRIRPFPFTENSTVMYAYCSRYDKYLSLNQFGGIPYHLVVLCARPGGLANTAVLRGRDAAVCSRMQELGGSCLAEKC